MYILGERIDALDSVQSEKEDKEHAGETFPPEI